ncbi:ANKRD17 [Symbiodinium microadriaticum]|nr:ANKRD17 [Symbiodinium microadriaticum]
MDYDFLHTESLSVWDEMEEKQLLGATTRRCFQHFSFAPTGLLWALATLLFCAYGAVCPNVGLVHVYGAKATRMIAVLLGLATMCSMSATSAAKTLLESEDFRQLLRHYETQTAEKESTSQRDVYDFLFECQIQSVLFVIKDVLVYGLLSGISFRPAFASDTSYFMGWLWFVGWMVVYSPGYKHVFRQVRKLSSCLVQELMEDMNDGPGKWQGTGKFWQGITKKHHRMDLKIESAWMHATWVAVPYAAQVVLFMMIGLVACLSAAVNSTSFLTALASLLVLAEVLGLARRLQEMASITRMCMSRAATSKSIMSLAIAQSGPSPYSPADIEKGGYDRFDDEREDHARFLTYLKANQCGVEMFGVLIDSGLILRVLAIVGTAFLALLSYLFATLDIHEDDLMPTYQNFTSMLPFKDADIFAYLCERPPDGGDLVYVTEGILRLSKRKEEDAPDHEKAADPERSQCGNSAKAAETDAGFVPHHSYRRKDIEMLPAEGDLTTARLKMFAAAYRFRARSKIVLVIAPDDAAHYAANPKMPSAQMLSIRSVSGEVLLTIELASFLETLALGSHPIQALKQRLQSLCHQPRFRQRLAFLDDGIVLNDSDDDGMLKPGDLQLVLLHFIPASAVQIKELGHAADRGVTASVEAILQRPQDPDLGHPAPLLIACRQGHLEVARLLLEAKADKDKATKNNATALFFAAQQGHLEVARLLLEAKADKNTATTDRGVTPLYVAAERGQLEVVRYLLEAKADKDHGTTDIEATPLLVAAQNGELEVARLLLEAKADKDKATVRGGTAFFAAAQQGHLQVARILLEAKAYKDKATSNNATPLFIAAQRGQLEIVQLLLAARADTDKATTDREATPLLVAAQNGHLEVAHVLLEAKANTNATPLFVAAERGQLEVVRFLLEAKADKDKATTDREATALFAAVQAGQLGVARLLLEAKAGKGSLQFQYRILCVVVSKTSGWPSAALHLPLLCRVIAAVGAAGRRLPDATLRFSVLALLIPGPVCGLRCAADASRVSGSPRVQKLHCRRAADSGCPEPEAGATGQLGLGQRRAGQLHSNGASAPKRRGDVNSFNSNSNVLHFKAGNLAAEKAEWLFAQGYLEYYLVASIPGSGLKGEVVVPEQQVGYRWTGTVFGGRGVAPMRLAAYIRWQVTKCRSHAVGTAPYATAEISGQSSTLKARGYVTLVFSKLIHMAQRSL